MADADSWTRIRQYAEQLLADEDVNEGMRRLTTAGRGAYARARDKKRTRDALTDRGFRRRLADAAEAANQLIEAVREAPSAQRRRRRRRTLTMLLAGGALVVVAVSRPVREKLSGLAGSIRAPERTEGGAPLADDVVGEEPLTAAPASP